MPPKPPRDLRLIDRPGRLLAITGAAAVSLLSVSGALGLSLAGSQTAVAQDRPPAHQSASRSAAAPTSAVQTSQPGAASPKSPSGGTTTSPPATSASAPADTSTAPADVALPANSGSGKRVVFAVGAQRVWLVGADNQVERTYLVSGSKYHNLQLGTYHVSSRSRVATAYNSDEQLPYMVRFAYGTSAPIGFHSIPVRPDGSLVEQRSQLGAPASDGCIRQWSTDARALWNFAPVGTTVVVHA